jgi:diguanylate cyclase (GGDEF)-like protein
VAGRIQSAIRSEDTVARYGGDEFVVILERIHGRDVAARVASKIIDVVSAPAQLRGETVDVGASIGIALTESPADDPDALLRNADAAMYLAKRAGRARFMFFDNAVDEQALTRSIVGKLQHISALPR